MQEDFLHYIWKFKKFSFHKAVTTVGEKVEILSPGIHNFNSGPDFFNATIIIGGQKWAGNVEIHINSSDYFHHNHQQDPAFRNLILHVVYNHDKEVIQNANYLPTLELKDIISPNAFYNYDRLLLHPHFKFINCENDFAEFSQFEVDNWLERMYLEKLQKKSDDILKIWKRSAGNWEEVCFKLLAKNFGLKVNGSSFLSMAESIPFSIVQKCSHSQLQLEALFFGQLGILQEKGEEEYLILLQQEYDFLRKKFKLSNKYVERPKYFRLRPDNFPSIRIAQFAALYHQNFQVFSEIIRRKSIVELRELLQSSINSFWTRHYTFKSHHDFKEKKLTPQFIDLLIINTIIPIRFTYLKQQGIQDAGEIIELIENINPEENSILKKFKELRRDVSRNALHSQALLHMKPNYCDKNFCLQCALGNKILGKID